MNICNDVAFVLFSFKCKSPIAPISATVTEEICAFLNYNMLMNVTNYAEKENYEIVACIYLVFRFMYGFGNFDNFGNIYEECVAKIGHILIYVYLF